jgi:hypothetical protein
MEMMKLLTRVSLFAAALALLVPGVARAVPIAFEFSGYVAKTGGFPGLAEGDPLAATLSYDTEVWTKIFDEPDHVDYTGGSLVFEVRAGPHTWSAYPSLKVFKHEDRVQIGLLIAFNAFAILEGPISQPAGGAAPTSLNLAALTNDQIQAFDLEHRLLGHFTSVVQTQGPNVDPVPAPEPATLTLSALGLAAIVARRRARRAGV